MPTKSATGSRPGIRRNAAGREEDLAKVMALVRKGYSQNRIAEILGVCQQQVSYDFRKCMAALRKDLVQDAQAIIDQKRLEYEDIRHQLYLAWQKSWDNIEKQVTEDNAATGGKMTTTVEGRLPDKSYLDLVLKAMREECELLGLYPTKEVQVNQVVTQVDVADVLKRVDAQRRSEALVVEAVEGQTLSQDAILNRLTARSDDEGEAGVPSSRQDSEPSAPCSDEQQQAIVTDIDEDSSGE